MYKKTWEGNIIFYFLLDIRLPTFKMNNLKISWSQLKVGILFTESMQMNNLL